MWRQNCSPKEAWSEHVPDVCCNLVLWQFLMRLDGEGNVAALSFEPYNGDKPIERFSWRNEIWWHVVDSVILGLWWNLMIQSVFVSLNDCMVLWPRPASPSHDLRLEWTDVCAEGTVCKPGHTLWSQEVCLAHGHVTMFSLDSHVSSALQILSGPLYLHSWNNTSPAITESMSLERTSGDNIVRSFSKQDPLQVDRITLYSSLTAGWRQVWVSLVSRK